MSIPPQNAAASAQTEPWMRGAIPGVHVFIAPLFYSFQMAREDLSKYTEGLTPEQLWATPHGFGSVGFHLRHIAGSTDRLMTYVEGGQLSDAQMFVLKAEKEPGATREMLLAGLDAAFARAEAIARALDPAHLTHPPTVHPHHLPTPVT